MFYSGKMSDLMALEPQKYDCSRSNAGISHSGDYFHELCLVFKLVLSFTNINHNPIKSITFALPRLHIRSE